MFAPVDAMAVDPQEGQARERLQRAVGPEYQVGRLVGRGGFADVFEAHEPRLGRRVAIKAVRPDSGASTEIIERFRREARAMAGLRHPHVMEIYTVGASDEVAFFVMPLVNGESLKSRIEREGALAIDEAIRILVEAAGALEAAHRAGTVHRDVKPDNILLEGDHGRVLITDFGIAKALETDTSSFTRSGFVGTPRYISPEQATGEETDHRTDVYSLGVVAFEMVAGRPPFEARTVQALLAKHLTEAALPLESLRPECPVRLARVVAKCLAKDPGGRWSSLAEVVQVLEGEDDLGSESVPLPVPSPQAALAPVHAFRRVAGPLLGALLALVLVDVSVGLGGISLWPGALVSAYLAMRAGRLWREGFEWRDLVVGSVGRPGAAVGSASSASGSADGEDYGRFSSLVRSMVSDRAGIMKSWSALPHQELNRLRALPPTVDGLLARARHLARRVVNLESRIAEAATRLERSDAAEAAQDRHEARLHELDSAREDAARELRACIDRLEELREQLDERVLEEAPGGMDEMARTLAEAEAYLSRRAV